MFKKILLITALGLVAAVFTHSQVSVKAEENRGFDYKTLNTGEADYDSLNKAYLNGDIDYDAIEAAVRADEDNNIDYDAMVLALGGEVVEHDPNKEVEFFSDKEAFLDFLENSKELEEIAANSYCYYVDNEGNVLTYDGENESVIAFDDGNAVVYDTSKDPEEVFNK